ncbi:MAG: ATP-dependent deoxyribonuclease subunit A [Deltaproteobacteria bacterium]|nr:MAG: ATP-dependent deoxyribonuclease subunit A [Deltaproteobacteria bacterium]
MTSTLADARARERIQTDLGATLVVEAAAGTGKTTELVARIVALVRTGRTTLDRILSVTFTDLAAGEMKLRLRSELEEARAAATVEERDRLTAALERLEAAPIGTIHSFCADLLRERPVEARVDPVFEVAAGEEQDRLFDQAFDGWFQRVIASPLEGVRRLLRRKVRPGDTPPRELLRQAGRDLSEHRDFSGPWRREPFDREAGLEQQIARLAELGELAQRAQRPDDWAAQSIAGIARWVAELRRRESVRPRDGDGLEAELHELCRRRLWNWRGGGKWFARDLEKASVLAQRDAIKAELQAFLDRADSDLAACLREELRPLSDAYEELKRGAGCLDFLDLLLRARDLVRDDAAVRAELSQRFTHVLVDEFQDTDPLQAEILLLIASEDPSESSWRNARPAPGKLFVVGDPKQSIYRFRRADIALYEDVKQLLLSAGAELLHLTTSFRSSPSIQEAVNAAFAPVMQGGTQASYVALHPFRSEVQGQPAVVALPAPRIYGEREKVANFRIEESYPDAVAAFIDWLLTKSGWKVSERDRKEPVPVEARHVCLLFKRMRNYGGDLTRGYVHALEARRIPHVLVGGRSYHAREEVLAMRAAATAIEWPDDELAVLAVLKGPLFALGDDALFLFRELHGRLHPLRPRPANAGPAESAVFDALALLGELHRQRNRRPIAATFSRLLDATRAHAGIALRPAGEQALANVLRVLDLARRFEMAGASSFRAFVDRLTAEAERGDAAEAPVVEEGAEGVRIMSVHKAKGLEFPVVILCDPCAPAAPRLPSRFVDPERKVWAMPVAGCAPGELLADAPALLQRDREEVIRVAYVASTRARDLLVAPVVADEELQGWLAPLNPVLHPAPLLRSKAGAAPGCPTFGNEAVIDRPEGALTALAVPPGLHRPQSGGHQVVWWDPRSLELDREVENWMRERDLLLVDEGAARVAAQGHEQWQKRRSDTVERGQRPSLHVETATARASSTAVEAVELAAVEVRTSSRPGGRRFGTLVHSVLAGIDLRATSGAIASAAAVQGRLVGATVEEVEAAAHAVEAALAHPLLRRAAESSECRREDPVVHRLDDGTLLEGVVDLAFRDGEGWTVVDFKTDARPESHPQYAAQVRLYCRAITAATGLPAKGALLAV